MTIAASETDTGSASGSQTTTSESSRRYPLRSSRTRTKDLTTAEPDDDYGIQGEQPTQKRSYRKKQARKMSRKGQQSATPSQVQHLTGRLQRSISFNHRSQLQATAESLSQNHLNPIFLRMAHWISAHPTEVGTYITNILN
jgi:hypothetical protein